MGSVGLLTRCWSIIITPASTSDQMNCIMCTLGSIISSVSCVLKIWLLKINVGVKCIIGASVSEPPLVDSTDDNSSDRDRVSPAESAFWYQGKCCDDDLGLQTRGRRAFPASAR